MSTVKSAEMLARARNRRVETQMKNLDFAGVIKALDNGMHPDEELSGGRRLLAMAAHQEDPAIFDTLLDHGASLNPSGRANGNGLFSCVRQEDVRGMNRMIAAGADAAETEGYVNKPPAQNILFSVGTVAPDVVRRLLDAGAWKALGKKDKRRDTPAEHLRRSRAAVVGETGEDYQPDLFDNNRLGVIGLMEHYAALPRLDFDKGEFTKADLFKADAAGNTPLDHPETWNRWPEVAETLKARGETVSLKELQQTDAKGKTWLTRAVECWSLPQVAEVLNNQGDKLDESVLLEQRDDKKFHPSEFFELAREHHQLGAIFNKKNLFQNPTLYQSLYSRLSDSEKTAIVPNPHTFRFSLGNPSTKGLGR